MKVITFCYAIYFHYHLDRIHETHSLYNVLKCVTLFLLHDFFFK